MLYKCLVFAGQEDFLSNIVHLFNVGSMLGQRRRRWPSIKTALDQCPVSVVSSDQFNGYINAVNLYSIGYRWPTLDRPRHAYSTASKLSLQDKLVNLDYILVKQYQTIFTYYGTVGIIGLIMADPFSFTRSTISVH